MTVAFLTALEFHEVKKSLESHVKMRMIVEHRPELKYSTSKTGYQNIEEKTVEGSSDALRTTVVVDDDWQMV